jgi:hypothetical protein
MTRVAKRMGGACAIAGAIALFVGTALHPMGADPNDARAAFAEYAADPYWVATHLTQLAGVALIVAALLSLAQELDEGRGRTWSRLAAAGAIGSVALAGALQAVDGVALRSMVRWWAAAPEAQREAAFAAAFAVRQVEIGFATMVSLGFGLVAMLFGVALLADARFAKLLGALAIVGGVPTALAGLVMASEGFSELEMAINMPANALLLLWMLVVGVSLWRRGGSP